MRKNKKLLLASVAAMGALALGVGATSTFAWYTASATVHATAAGSPYGITTTQTTASLSNLTITLTISQVGNNVELSHYDSTNVKYGTVPNGIDAETTQGNWDGNQSSHRIVGEYQVTAEASPTDAQKEALKNKSFDINLESLSNVVILSGAAGDYTDAASYLAGAKTTAASPKVTVSFDNNGAIVAECVESNPYFRVEPNNTAGRDYFAASNALGQVAPGWVSGTSYTADTSFVLQGGKVYRCKTTNSDDEFTATKWTLVDHAEDKIQVVAGQNDISPNPNL